MQKVWIVANSTSGYMEVIVEGTEADTLIWSGHDIWSNGLAVILRQLGHEAIVEEYTNAE
jgi:hypothetical protein